MRSTVTLTFLALAAVACGGDDLETGDAAAGADATQERGIEEHPGLPTESTDFQATPWTETDAPNLAGTLWVSTARTVEQNGFSLVAQLRGLPTEHAYAWAIHRGDCSAADSPVLPLGYGAVAGVDGRGPGDANVGGPTGEAKLTFTPQPDGTAEETVFVPLDGDLSRAELESRTHSVRLHPDEGRDQLGPSTACAPLPPLPREEGQDTLGRP